MSDDATTALSSMCPPVVIEALKRKRAERHPALEALRSTLGGV
jgi:hypothetical protein